MCICYFSLCCSQISTRSNLREEFTLAPDWRVHSIMAGKYGCKIGFGLWWQKCAAAYSDLVMSGKRMLEHRCISPLSVQDSTIRDGTAYILVKCSPFD